MTSPTASPPQSGTSSESVPVNSGTNFIEGTTTILFNPHSENGDAAFHMNKTVQINYGEISSDTASDVSHRLKAMLQAKYLTIKIPKMPWIDYTYEFPLEHYYVDLTVKPKEDNRRSLLAKEIQLHEIFNPIARKSATRILVEGQAGYGKSMLALKLCYDYAKGEEYISRYELVILLSLRDFRESGIDEMLAKKLVLTDYTSNTIVDSIKKTQESVMIILDGYDESDQSTRDKLNPLFTSECLPEATVIVTTRPGVVTTMENFAKRLEIKGVKGTNRRQFLKLHIRSCSRERKEFLKHFLHSNFGVALDEGFILTRLFRKVQRTLYFVQESETVIDCPLFLLLIVTVARNGYPNTTLFTSKTELFKKLFNFIAQRTLSERVQSEETIDLFDFDVENPPSCVESLSQFGKLAVSALKIKRFIFTREEILTHCNDDVLQMGLLTENDSVDDVAGQQTTWFQPIHLSILEFCAAYHIWYTFKRSSSVDFPIEFLPELSGEVELFVFPFVIGLCGYWLLPFFYKLLNGKFPDDLIRRFTRCKSLISESVLDGQLLTEALLLLVPTVWRTSYFKDGNYVATDLLKETVAEAGSQGRLECIVHDADLDWNFSCGKDIPLLDMIAMTINSSKQSLRCAYTGLNFYEFRIFLESVANVPPVPFEHVMISFVETENSKKATSFLSTEGLYKDLGAIILRPSTNFELTVVGPKNVSGPLNVWRVIGRNVLLYKSLVTREL